MKNIVICIKLPKLCLFIIFTILILGISFWGIKNLRNVQKFEKDTIETIAEDVQQIDNGESTINAQLIENSELPPNIQLVEDNEIAVNSELNVIREQEIIGTSINKKEEYENMPREVKGHKVIGKIQIPKIELEAYILAETNKNTLSVSATKLYGPKINEVGNFCIAGHNYNKMFGKIKDLETKDNIILTDTYDNSITYEVYDTFQTSPKDVTCLNQDTEGDRELTLITCTKGAIKRVIIKAVEVYD